MCHENRRADLVKEFRQTFSVDVVIQRAGVRISGTLEGFNGFRSIRELRFLKNSVLVSDSAQTEKRLILIQRISAPGIVSVVFNSGKTGFTHTRLVD